MLKENTILITDVVRAAAHPLVGEIDERAVEPLERTVEWEEGEVPETFQTGI